MLKTEVAYLVTFPFCQKR